VVVELWGHGKSPSPEEQKRYEPHGYIEEFENIREELEIDRIWLIGQSMGAALVMHYAVSHPERVGGLIITNSASGFAEPTEWQERNRTMVSKIADQVDEEGVECLRDSWINPGRSKRIATETLKLLANEFSEHTAAACALSTSK
jgi:Predicted hydrolases or acyltransferases (alpha/beta hydrolase superfamily)